MKYVFYITVSVRGKNDMFPQSDNAESSNRATHWMSPPSRAVANVLVNTVVHMKIG
jgi:hypothetical protein